LFDQCGVDGDGGARIRLGQAVGAFEALGSGGFGGCRWRQRGHGLGCRGRGRWRGGGRGGGGRRVKGGLDLGRRVVELLALLFGQRQRIDLDEQVFRRFEVAGAVSLQALFKQGGRGRGALASGRQSHVAGETGAREEERGSMLTFKQSEASEAFLTTYLKKRVIS